MKYYFDNTLQAQAHDIVDRLNEQLGHVKKDEIACIKSIGSKARGTIARCHALGKVMQLALGRPHGFYVLEFISERFDKMSEQEKIKVIIHELMHIPKTFGGGFKHHDFVNEKNVEKLFREYIEKVGK